MCEIMKIICAVIIQRSCDCLQAHRLSDGGSSAHVDAVVTRIVHVFADALPHVPDHRRLPVLAQLVTTLGPARFLWVLMLLLFKLHATQTASSVSEKVRRFFVYESERMLVNNVHNKQEVLIINRKCLDS